MKTRFMLVFAVLFITLAALTASAQSDSCKDTDIYKCMTDVNHLRLENDALSMTNIQMQMQLLQKEYLRLEAALPGKVQSIKESMELGPEWQIDGERKGFLKISPK